VSDLAKGRVLKISALTIDILAPLVATLTQFPIWIDKSAEATVSGVAMLLVFFSCIPALKYIKAFIKSPSVPIVWLVVFVMLTMLNNIIDQMIVVAFIGVISNTLGTMLYKIGEKYTPRKEQ
jgi:hypothetical protein